MIPLATLSVFIKFFTAMFAIVNPIGAAPIFVAITGDKTKQERRKSIWVVGLTVFLILSFFTFFGHTLLELFGITIGSFRIAGGLILLLMSLSMLNAQPSRMKADVSKDQEDVEIERDDPAIFPFSIPLLAGPGAIATVIVITYEHPGFFNLLAINATLALLSISVMIALVFATVMSQYLGRTGLNVITRLMGILLAAISVEIIVGGIYDLFPALHG